MNETTEHPVDALLTDYHLGRLDILQAHMAERHLDSCPACAARAEQMRPRDSLIELLNTAARSELCQALNGQLRSSTLVAAQASTSVVMQQGEPVCHDFDSHMPDDPIPPELADHPRYRVIKLLGRGGMGTVWLAEHLVLGRMVALKMLRGDWTQNLASVSRFYREIRAAAKLHHPNIAAVFDAEQIENSHVLVMEYVEGESLADIVSRGPLPIAEACRAIRDTAAGLAHAHAARLIHRDVKPGNIIRTATGVVKLLDFGLVVSPDDGGSLTGPSMVMGTPDYISPEQADDPHSANEQSDIYSLGCTFYHLLSGRIPFPSSTVLRKLDAQRMQAPAALTSLPLGLWNIVAKMMAKDPSDRFASVDELAETLQPYCSSAPFIPTSPVQNSAQASVTKGGRGWRTWSWTLCVMFAAGVILFGVIFRIKTDHGELVIVTRDKDVDVVVRQAGSVVTIVDTKTRNRIQLSTGIYELSLDGDSSQLELDTNSVEISRGDKVIATVRHVKSEPDVLPALIHESPGYSVIEKYDYRFTGHTQLVRNVEFSPDSQTLYSVSDDGTLRSWNLKTREAAKIFVHRESDGNPVRLFGITLPEDGSTVITSQDDRLRIWDVATATERLPGFDAVTPDNLELIDLNADGSQIVTGSVSGKLRVWDVATRKLIAEINGVSTDPIYSVHWIPGRSLVLADNGAYLCLFDTAIKDCKDIAKSFAGYCSAAVSHDGLLLGGIWWDGLVQVYSFESGTVITEFPSNGRRLRFLRDGRIVTNSANGSIDVWDSKGQQVYRLRGDKTEGVPLAVSPDGKWIATGGSNHNILLWSVPPLLPSATSSSSEPGAAAEPLDENRSDEKVAD